ncbi:hypothetical protein ABE137_00665 [Brevibacillus laterosporus]
MVENQYTGIVENGELHVNQGEQHHCHCVRLTQNKYGSLFKKIKE